MMKNLHIKEILKEYLYDLNNFITIYDNYLHVFNYKKLNKISDKEISILLDNKEFIIIGIDLKIKQMTKQELLIMGIIEKVEFSYV